MFPSNQYPKAVKQSQKEIPSFNTRNDSLRVKRNYLASLIAVSSSHGIGISW